MTLCSVTPFAGQVDAGWFVQTKRKGPAFGAGPSVN